MGFGMGLGLLGGRALPCAGLLISDTGPHPHPIKQRPGPLGLVKAAL